MKTNIKKLSSKMNVVGVIASEEDMQEALRNPQGIDIFELRIDKYQPSAKLIAKLKRPLIITVRCVEEGGSAPMNIARRIELYLKYMRFATLIDVEARTADSLQGVIALAKKRGIGIIISLHMLGGIVEHTDMTSAAMTCSAEEGDIFKVALKTESFDQIGEFICAVVKVRTGLTLRVAAMIIGERYGKSAQLLFGVAGSPLVYGYLAKAQVKGQLRASDIGELLAKVS